MHSRYFVSVGLICSSALLTFAAALAGPGSPTSTMLMVLAGLHWIVGMRGIFVAK